MFSTTFLTGFLLLAVSVAGKPTVVPRSPVSLSIARKFSNTGTRDLVQRDRIRARNLLSVGTARESGTSIPGPVGVTNVDGSGYVASVGVGTPPTQYTLIVDSGSANTWVGARKAYVKTITSVKTDQHVNVTYGTGSVFGNEYLDTVTLGSGVVICKQSLGAAINSTAFASFGLDGTIGFGPKEFTNGTLIPDKNRTIPTVTDNLFSQGKIATDIVAISFAPVNKLPEKNGEILFGATDSTKFTGEITFLPHSSAGPVGFNAANFWSIDQSIRYANQTILETTSGIVDTGTTLILVPTDALERYKSATGAIPDDATGLLTITKTQYSSLQSLFFTIGGIRTFEFVANAQIWPRSLNTVIGGNASSIYLIVGGFDGLSTQNQAKDLRSVLGLAFLERFYSVYDTTRGKVGLATTSHTRATTN